MINVVIRVNFEHLLKFKQYNNIILYYLLLTDAFPASTIVVPLSTFFTLPTLSLDVLWILFLFLSYVMCFLLCGSLPFASHAHTNKPIVLISHPSKLLLNVLQKILEVFLIPELPIEQAGFRRGGGTRDHISTIRWMMERAREHQQYLCFIDFKKVFDCGDRSRGNVDYLRDGVPTHQVVLLINMYANQKAGGNQNR